RATAGGARTRRGHLAGIRRPRGNLCFGRSYRGHVRGQDHRGQTCIAMDAGLGRLGHDGYRTRLTINSETMNLYLERRTEASRTALLLAPLAAIVFTLLVCALLVTWAGAPVGRTYALLFDGAFGSRFALSETMMRATPL